MLILLDIDGVMVLAKSWQTPKLAEDGFPEFNLRAVNALQKILSETKAAVLLTSSHKTSYTISQWRALLKSRGINPKKLQRLESNSLNTSRKEEIQNWYQQKHNPREEFVIIDDDKMLNGLPEDIKNKLVLTSPSIGLTDDLAEDAIAILMKSSLQTRSEIRGSNSVSGT